MILIFCKHSGQNNIQESAGTAWSRHMIMHRHDDSPSVGRRLGRRPSRVCINCSLARSFQRQISRYQGVRKPQQDHPNERHYGEVPASLVLISGLSNKTTFNKELWTSSFPLYSIKPNLRNLFMKKLTRDRVVPIISASVS